MSNTAKLLSACGGSPLYSDEVFSSYTRTGTGADVTVTTGIDMTQGYMLWTKGRSGTTDHAIYDSTRGVTYDLVSNSTTAQTTQSTGLKSVSATGHTVGSLAKMNTSAATYVDFVFRKSAKFFDVVTYTGNGANRTISHSLGIVPGMIMVKRTDTTGSWMVYHNSIANTENMVLNTTAAKVTNATAWNSTTATASVFSLGTHADVNTNGGTYVAYLFAHDTSADGIIQCGSFTTSGGSATLNLGWEPQYFLRKGVVGTGAWIVLDASRGMAIDAQSQLFFYSSAAEAVGFASDDPTATGMSFSGIATTETYIYLAIRRPNKPPTLGTQVYNAIARTGTGAAATVTGVGFAPDLVVGKNRTSYSWNFIDRLRGALNALLSNSTSSETSYTGSLTAFGMDGVVLGADAASGAWNESSSSNIEYNFKRAPGVFDIVCYTGTGVAKTEAHGLGVVPELMIVKDRTTAVSYWMVYHKALGDSQVLYLQTTYAAATQGTVWNSTDPTASVFSLGTDSDCNGSTKNIVNYLFATKAGISKVGSYTGNGSNQTINCGFTTGSRFILIKRTDASGDWFVFDTVRGIVAGNDPHLSLNTTAAEVTTDDSIDPDSTGFIVNQVAATNLNVTSATYIFLSFA